MLKQQQTLLLDIFVFLTKVCKKKPLYNNFYLVHTQVPNSPSHLAAMLIN